MEGLQLSPFVKKIFDLLFGEKDKFIDSNTIRRNFERALALIKHSKFQNDESIEIVPKLALTCYVDALHNHSVATPIIDNAFYCLGFMLKIPHAVDFFHWFRINLKQNFKPYYDDLNYEEFRFLYYPRTKKMDYNRGLYCLRYFSKEPNSHAFLPFIEEHLKIKAFYQETIFSWMIISKRLRIPKDVALLIARQVWEHRFFGI